jgi:RNA polymerase sigma-70 factor (ECF subfamily)
MVNKVSTRKVKAVGRTSSGRGKGLIRKKKPVKKPVAEGAGADLELVERFRDGDLGAFDSIFETYSGPLLGFLTRMCGDAEDAKEGLQDTFLSVFRYLKDFRGEATLKNWIFKIAVNACLKKKRKMEAVPCGEIEGIRRANPESEDSMDPVLVSEGSPEWKLDPEKLMLDGEFRQHIVQGVASMPYIYKVVINLRDFEGFSTQDVSRILGIKESTVKVRLHRARLYLQDWLRKRYKVSD